jgi:predicted ABC-class ATPase
LEQLRKILQRIDRKGYKAYKELQGSYRFPDFTLYIDYVQGDPFAAPSRIRLRVNQNTARFPEDWYGTYERRVALEDELTRAFARAIRDLDARADGSGKSGMILIDTPGQEVLERSAMVVNQDFVEARVSVGLPAAGRSVLARQAERMLCEQIPQLVRKVLFSDKHQPQKIDRLLCLADDQAVIRQVLKEKGWVAFIADDSILPRESGVSDRPLKTGKIVPFKSPPPCR